LNASPKDEDEPPGAASGKHGASSSPHAGARAGEGEKEEAEEEEVLAPEARPREPAEGRRGDRGASTVSGERARSVATASRVFRAKTRGFGVASRRSRVRPGRRARGVRAEIIFLSLPEGCAFDSGKPRGRRSGARTRGRRELGRALAPGLGAALGVGPPGRARGDANDAFATAPARVPDRRDGGRQTGDARQRRGHRSCFRATETHARGARGGRGERAFGRAFERFGRERG
jgi:hypothetical protein